MDLHLHDHVILVTGGAKGIGESISRVLAAEGAVPLIIGRNRADNEAAVERILAAGGRAASIEAELTRTEECQRAVEWAVATFSRIDGLVNNAGINDGVSLEHGNTEQFIASLRKNLLHYYELAHFRAAGAEKVARRDCQHRLESRGDRTRRHERLRRS